MTTTGAILTPLSIVLCAFEVGRDRRYDREEDTCRREKGTEKRKEKSCFFFSFSFRQGVKIDVSHSLNG
ncbi:hypothetical protein Hanom_Chr14g01323981 [Helianthus anomalus]